MAWTNLRRVLRPGGAAIVSVPLVWEYDPTILEHRYTGPELTRLFADWEDVRVVANGERAIAWATLTGRMLEPGRGTGRRQAPRTEGRLRGSLPRPQRRSAPSPTGPRGESPRGTTTLPMNLLLTARRP